MTFKAPYLTYRDVGKYAEDFLTKYHPALELPIPIEWIIEFNLGLNIVPIPYLYKTFKQSGFLSANRKIIFIDEYQYDNFVEKYRFTLAHEIGHFVMHESMYEGLSFDSVQEYIKFMHLLPQSELYWYETQSDWFAEQLLVPTTQLEKSCIDLLESNRSQFSEIQSLSYEFWSYASNELSDYFEVNPIVIDIRIQRENFVEKFKNFYQ